MNIRDAIRASPHTPRIRPMFSPTSRCCVMSSDLGFVALGYPLQCDDDVTVVAMATRHDVTNKVCVVMTTEYCRVLYSAAQ